MSKTLAVALRGCKIAAQHRNKSVRNLIMRSMNVKPLMMRWVSVCTPEGQS
jgi:hypothetical protein